MSNIGFGAGESHLFLGLDFDLHDENFWCIAFTIQTGGFKRAPVHSSAQDDDGVGFLQRMFEYPGLRKPDREWFAAKPEQGNQQEGIGGANEPAKAMQWRAIH